MENLYNYYFGPLEKSNCNYYLILSIIAFVLFAVSLINTLFSTFKSGKLSTLTNNFYSVAILFLSYYVNRLLYSMCVGSLH